MRFHSFRRAIDWLRLAILPPRPGPRSTTAKAFLPLFLILAAGHLVVIGLCAPYIKADGSTYTATTMRDFVVPHAAPLYPIFVRSINAVVHNAGAWVGAWPTAEGPTWSLIRPAPYSNASIYLILIVQHLLLAWAASWFAVSITDRKWLRFATAISLSWSPPIVAAAQRIQTEGLWNPLVIAALGFCIRFLTEPERPLRNLNGLFACLTLAMLVRSPGNVFLAVLPLALAFLGLAQAVSRRRLQALWPYAIAATGAAGLGLLALIGVSQIKKAVLIVCDVEPRPAFGRPGMQRIHPKALHPYEGITRQDLDEIVLGLERRTEDPQVRQTLRIIVSSNSFWVEPFNRVRQEIVAPAYPDYNYGQTLAPTDRLLNQAARLAYTSTDPRMLRSIALRTTRFLQLGPGLQGCSARRKLLPFREQMATAEGFAEKSWLTEGLLANVSAARDINKLQRALALEWVSGLVRPPKTRVLWLATIALLGWTIARRRFGPASSVAVAIVTTTLIYASLMAVAGCFSARRSEIVVLLTVCAVALLTSEICGEAENGDSDTPS